MSLKTIGDRSKLLFAELRQKGWRYWLTVLALIFVGTIAGDWLGEHSYWIRLRYRIYNEMQVLGTLAKPDKKTVLVLITDEEYWKGYPERRVPLKRDYLASLLKKLAEAEPNMIALDVDLRSPIPQQGSQELERYRDETRKLLDAINEVSQKRRVVLATTVTCPERDCELNPNVFDDYPFNKEKVLHGYTMLRPDLRQVPLSIKVTNRAEREDSFASAIAKTRREAQITAAEQYEELPYGYFVPPDDFDTFTANDVFNMNSHVKDKLQGQIVIVGGAWHTQSYVGNRDITDDSVDVHFTPAGNMQGAYVHANYVEALLNGTVRQELSHNLAMVIEILCSVLVAVIFALEGSFLKKVGEVLVLCAALVVVGYFLWQNLGLFFDFFLPIVLLSAHAPVEEFRETRAELHRLKKQFPHLEHKDQTRDHKETGVQENTGQPAMTAS